MRRALKPLLTGYRLLLRFYPTPFRSEFGGEMEQVFGLTVQEAASAGTAPLGRLVLREVIDWPGALGREWACVLQARFCDRKEATVEDQLDVTRAVPGAPAPWGEAILAGLVLLVPGLILSTKELPFLQEWWPILMLGVYAFCSTGRIGPMAVAWVLIVAIMLMPALLGLLRRAVGPRGSAKAG